MKIGIASDHAGFELKEYLKESLKKEGYSIIDYGPEVKKVVDYPDYGEKVARGIQNKEIDYGILICGTGIGMDIVANKFKGVRAARCCSIYDAVLAREHNNANVITLGGRLIGKDLAFEIVKIFISTPFTKGRHLKRVNKIKRIENERYTC
ncbi:MAG: ribose 5-phosphate isomerase B [bacterium]|nr:ribose 5-phosphate isomerase B [bacterium]MCX7917506.1 ribose 5-phosphate isomerase B [bacterium]MDW8163768.1 ribose 5-phosphate isomerase B [Candidatus Omnitrophota bacterium]